MDRALNQMATEDHRCDERNRLNESRFKTNRPRQIRWAQLERRYADEDKRTKALYDQLDRQADTTREKLDKNLAEGLRELELKRTQRLMREDEARRSSETKC